MNCTTVADGWEDREDSWKDWCRYNYVMFCHYNKDYRNYHAICESFLNKRATALIKVYDRTNTRIAEIIIKSRFKSVD